MALAHLTVAALRRNPRVYNALITTDQNLTPSRSYPVIQPHIEYPALSYSSGPGSLDPNTWLNPYNPYYSPYFGAEYPLGLGAPQPLPFDGRHFEGPHPAQQQPSTPQQPNKNDNNNDDSDTNGSTENDTEGKSSDNDQASNNANADQSNNEQNQQSDNDRTNQQQSPQSQQLPLNQFGLPPNLVPFNPLYNSWNLQRHPDPVNLSPYPYNSYPLIYDQIPSYQPSPFLPPYGLFTPELRRPQPPSNAPSAGKRDNKNNRRNNQSSNSKDKKDNSSKDQPKDDSNKKQPSVPEQQQDNEQKEQEQTDQSNTNQQNKQQQTKMNEQQQQPQDQQQQQQQKRRQAKQERLEAPIVVGNSDAAIKNFDPINRNVPDVPYPPPPSGSKDMMA